jgi:hypothetical protein
MVVAKTDPARIASATPVQHTQAQAVPDYRMGGIPVLDMEEIPALSEDPAFVIILDPETLVQVYGAHPPPELLIVRYVNRRRAHLSAKFRQR